jgi:hypothetical protein
MTYGSKTWEMTIKEMNTLRIFERKIVRKIYELVKEGEPWRIRTNKEIKNTLQRQDIVTFPKSLHLRWYKQVERMQKQDIPKQIAACAMEGIK